LKRKGEKTETTRIKKGNKITNRLVREVDKFMSLEGEIQSASNNVICVLEGNLQRNFHCGEKF
jgi:hypothetical protein